jgi:hypothetical protein
MRRVRVGQTLLIAGACYLLPLGANVVASFLTDWTGGGTWLVAPTVGLAAAMLVALVQAFGSAEAPTHDRPYPEPWPGQPSVRDAPRGTPLLVALVVAVAVIGLGGWAVMQGVRYGVGYVTGNEPGTERLRMQASGGVDGLTLTVESVEQTAHFTRVGLAARNTSPDTAILTVYKNTFLNGIDGTTLEGDGFRSRWSETVVPGSRQRGTITFKGHLPNSVRRAKFSFASVGGPFFLRHQGPVQVPDIRLRRG